MKNKLKLFCSIVFAAIILLGIVACNNNTGDGGDDEGGYNGGGGGYNDGGYNGDDGNGGDGYNDGGDDDGGYNGGGDDNGNGGATTITTYTISYNINGGSGTQPMWQIVNAGSSVTLASGSGLSKSGYTFGGWNTNSSGTGTNYNAGSSFTPTGTIDTIILYAKWSTTGGDGGETTTYTVNYNTNGGSGTTPSSQTVNAGSSITLASGSGLSKSGYTFGGWNTNSSGTGATYLANTNYIPTSDIMLYAKWNSGSGGGTDKPDNVTSGSVTVLSNTSLQLTWTAVSGATSYNIYRSTSSSRPSTPTFTSTTNSYTNTGLTTGQQYLYWVSAVNSAGESALATYIGAGIPANPAPTDVPDAPTGVNATTLGTDGYTVTWNSVTNATKYEVQYSTNGSTWYFEDETTQTFFISTGWLNIKGTFVYFRVRAYNSIGWGPYSSAFSTWRSL